MKSFIRKYGFWIGIFLFVIVVIININHSNKELKKNGIVLNAVLVDIVTTYRGSPEYRYQFSYRGKIYIEKDGSGIRKLNKLLGNSFPIMFSPITNNSELLMTPEDFKKFDIPFPDSLKWVLKFRSN